MLDLDMLAFRLGELLLQRQWYCVVAESCTGGGLAAAITEIPGSSQWFDRGFVTYSNKAKKELLKVPMHILAHEGAVSEACALAMAEGAILASDAECSIAVTGIAGPTGGDEKKPVGTVWIAWKTPHGLTKANCYDFKGNRHSVRQQAIQQGLLGMIQRLQQGE